MEEVLRQLAKDHNLLVHDNQVEGAAALIDKIFSSSKRVLLTADCQSGKTGVWQLVTLYLKEVTGWTVFVYCAMPHMAIKEQIDKDAKEVGAIYYPPHMSRNGVFSAALQEAVQENPGKVLVIIDEAHYGWSWEHLIGKALAHLLSDLKFLLITATPQKLIEAHEQHGVTLPIVHLQSGAGYMGIRRFNLKPNPHPMPHLKDADLDQYASSGFARFCLEQTGTVLIRAGSHVAIEYIIAAIKDLIAAPEANNRNIEFIHCGEEKKKDEKPVSVIEALSRPLPEAVTLRLVFAIHQQLAASIRWPPEALANLTAFIVMPTRTINETTIIQMLGRMSGYRATTHIKVYLSPICIKKVLENADDTKEKNPRTYERPATVPPLTTPASSSTPAPLTRHVTDSSSDSSSDSDSGSDSDSSDSD
jgi:hypothetical protein